MPQARVHGLIQGPQEGDDTRGEPASVMLGRLGKGKREKVFLGERQIHVANDKIGLQALSGGETDAGGFEIKPLRLGPRGGTDFRRRGGGGGVGGWAQGRQMRGLFISPSVRSLDLFLPPFLLLFLLFLQ